MYRAMSQEVKTRFCPSPTGLVHLGNVRTALFNALLAKHHQGVFLLRMEDTDKERSDVKFAEALMEDLSWLGLHWQEGPEVGGDQGPYWQSERQPIYDEYYQTLIDNNQAYPCFCSEQELAIERKVMRASGKPPRYSGKCRDLTEDQRQAKLTEGVKPTLRFRVDANESVTFTDLVRGEQTFHGRDIGDFIIRRANGTSPFMFCNAIDDARMGVTHALRGEDHLTNTPRQLMILKALGLSAPEYGHISLIVGADGSPLSKRHGSRSIQELRAAGYMPNAVVNYLARLGHHYPDESLQTFDSLSQQFMIGSLGHAPAKYDEAQLRYWQKEAVASADTDTIWQWLGESVHKRIDNKNAFVTLVQPNIFFPEDGLHWAHLLTDNALVFNDDKQAILKEAGAGFFEAALSVLKDPMDYASFLTSLKTKVDAKGKKLFQPLRLALSSEMHGPEMVGIYDYLGHEKVKARFKHILSFVS